MLVAAVLAPHERVDGKLDVGRLALLDAADVGVLVGREAELDGGLDAGAALLGRAHRATTRSRTLSMIDGEEDAAVGAAGEAGLDRVLGVRHEAEDVEVLVADAGDVVERAVGAGAADRAAAALAGLGAVGGAVAQHDLAVVAHAGQGVGVDPVVALVVLDDDAQHVAGLGRLGEGRAGVLDAQVDVAADELEADVADERARQQVGFGQDLEAVADAHDEAAAGGEVGDRGHDGAEAGDGAAAQVVAVGEAAGDDDGVDVAQVGVLVPEPDRLGAGEGGDGVPGVVVGVDAREHADADAHGVRASALSR